MHYPLPIPKWALNLLGFGLLVLGIFSVVMGIVTQDMWQLVDGIPITLIGWVLVRWHSSPDQPDRREP